MASLKPVVLGTVIVIIAIVVLFSIVGNMSTEITDSADAVARASNCSDYPADSAGYLLEFHPSATNNVNCTNSTNDADTGLPALEYQLPLRNLFSGSGVVLVVFMAMLMLVIIGVVLKARKK